MQVYLVQSDTTVGFACRDSKRLNRVKKREEKQPVLQTVESIEKIKKETRVPKKDKRLLRRAKETTFILPNKQAYRIVSGGHHPFVSKFGAIYSTSANENKKAFDLDWAKETADIIVYDKKGFFEGKASKIFKLTKKKRRRVR